MTDDLDNQIRGAMKVLDEETPAGYFDAVPNQILARLEDGTMQSSGTTDMRDKRDALMGPPVAAEDIDTKPSPKVAQGSEARDEDSGLHDIRNLAQSTKQRLSSRRITVNPPMGDEDVLAASSGSWKNIALPQPAKMVALPELEDLPSKQEVLAAQKAAAKARKQKPTGTEKPLASDDVLAPVSTANAAAASMTAAPVAATATETVDSTSTASVATRQAFSLPSMEQKKSKGALYAFVGVGLAAAAGALIYTQMGSSEKPQQSAAVAPVAETAPAPTPAPAAAPTAEPIVAAGSAEEPKVEEAKVEEPKVEEAKVAAADDTDKVSTKRKAVSKAGASSDKKDEPKAVEAKKPDVAEIKKPDGTTVKAGGGADGAEPSFDALLKEAGVEEKKEAKPKLDKKSLSSDDFKKGMAAVNSKATSCYKGTQGTAIVKLTVAPSGAVTKVSVAGAFAGTPEGACVESAVKSATFPAWDGGPQTFNYSYMLAD